MKSRAGFTLIELLVTITIMVILMTLAVVNIRSTQVRARDEERKSDTENIMRHLDEASRTGYTLDYQGTPVSLKGSYPPTIYMEDEVARSDIFEEIPGAVLIAPGKDSVDDSLFMATNAVPTANGVFPVPGSAAPYVYQPIATDGDLCDTAGEVCQKYYLYYRSEVSNNIIQLRGRSQ